MQMEALLVAAVGFALCAAAMLGLLVHLRRGPRWGLAAWTMAAAAGTCAIWATCGFAFAIDPTPGRWLALRWADQLQAAAWIAFVLVLLREGRPGQEGTRAGGRFVAWVSFALLLAVGVGGLVPTPAPIRVDDTQATSTLGLIASLALAIAGLVCVEQLLRRVPASQRWSVWPLAIALGGVFAFELYLYADAVLLGRLDSVAWGVHGAVVAFATPLLGIAASRNKQWSKPLAVSHGAAFHSTVLLASAAYLLGVAALGYLVRMFGGAWGPALQVVLFAAALMVMGVLLTLGRFRSKLRVLIGKNFFKQRYDYREEWIRFTRLIAGRDESTDIYVRCIQALANLVESTAGTVWLKRQAVFGQVARWNAAADASIEPADSDLATFMQRTGWIIDLQEHRQHPQRYQGLLLPGWLVAAPGARLVVPLIANDALCGFVVLMSLRVEIDIDWEVIDLLKVAGSEVAALLRQIEVTQALAEAEKFAAVNRRSAFMVHDLKNLVAQLSLMLKSAERHGDNPEFRRDMMETVQHVVDRMGLMLNQAKLSTRPLQNPRSVDVAAIARQVCDLKRVQRPGLRCEADGPIHAVGHVDRIEHVLAHVVQNAVDATVHDGVIRVSVARSGADVTIEVEDNGTGMSTEFVQQRLFKPFETTKDSGMGIGVYESQHYVSELGGRMHIDSAEGLGTCVRIVLPAADVEGERA